MGRSKRRRSSSESSEESARYSERRHRSEYREDSYNRRSNFAERGSECSRRSESEKRIDRLEKLVESLVKKNSGENSQQRDKPFRYAVGSDCIPEFEPGNPNLTASKWIDKIEQLADINGWDNKTTIYHMQSRLSGLAKSWYHNLNTYDRSWEEWKELIKGSFPDHRDFAATLRKLVNRRKEEKESMTEYYYAKMELINTCKIAGKDAVSCIIDGLEDPTVQTGARAGRYCTPEALYTDFLSTIVETEKPRSYKYGEKTLEYIKTKYWFASMRKYVKKYISCCLACLYNKVPAGKQSGELNVIEKVAVPFDTLHADHLGPFVKSSQRNTHLLTVIDGFTKFIFLKAVPNTKVVPVVKMFDDIINTFGVPRRIVCDRGSCFTSEKFTQYCTKLGIKRILNATATPRANGQAERYNRTILSSISSSSEDEAKWDRSVPSIQWGLNVTVNKTTGKSPYELLLGYTPRSPNDSYITNEVCEDEVRDLNRQREEASLTIRKNQSSQKKYYDGKRTKARTYEVGDYVVIRRSKGSNDGASRKLLPKYSGPYVIRKVLDHDRYVVEDLPGAKRSRKKYTGICPSDKLKIYRNLSDTDDNASDGTEE